MPAIDQIPEHMGRGRGVAVGGDLAEADVVEDEKLVAGPATQAGIVGAVGEAGVELGEAVGEAGEADTVPPSPTRDRRPESQRFATI